MVWIECRTSKGRGGDLARKLQEHRFTASFADAADLKGFRKALVDLAGAFTEVVAGDHARYIVGLETEAASEALRRLLADWQGQTHAKTIEFEDRATAPDAYEIYFLLPLRRNPEPKGGARRPLFTNEEIRDLRTRLARLFQFRPELVRVDGEWRDQDCIYLSSQWEGELVYPKRA